jgi:hypothetical protein
MADWRENLGGAFKGQPCRTKEQEAAGIVHFVQNVAIPAFEEIRSELEKYGRDVTLRRAEASATLLVYNDGEEEITYRIQSRTFPKGVVPFAEMRFKERGGLKLVRKESMFRSGKPDYTIADVTGQEIIDNFLLHYTPLVQRS